MAACYENAGIRFLYPENWTITEDEVPSCRLSVSVQSPESGFWSLAVYGGRVNPRDLVEQVLESMCREYEGVECTRVVERFGDVRPAGYEMCFYCLDFIVNSRAIAARARGKTLLIMWQAEDREYQQLEPVFRAITSSLFRGEPRG